MPNPNFDTISNSGNSYDSRRNTKRAAKDFAFRNNDLSKNFTNPGDFNDQALKAANEPGMESPMENTEMEPQNQTLENGSEDQYYNNPYDYYSDEQEDTNDQETSDNNYNNELENPEDTTETRKEPGLGENADVPKENQEKQTENETNNQDRSSSQNQVMSNTKKEAADAKKAAIKQAEKEAAKKAAKKTAEKAAARSALAATSEIWIPILIIGIILLVFFFVVVAYNNPGTGNNDNDGGGGSVDGNKIIQIASAEINHCESPLGSDSGPDINYYFTDMGWSPGVPWCAAFVSWVYSKAGYPVPRTEGAVDTIADTSKFDVYDLGGTNIPQAGDIIVRDFNGGHVGLVESYSNGTLTVIEGNTSSGCVHRNTYYQLRDNWSRYGRLK